MYVCDLITSSLVTAYGGPGVEVPEKQITRTRNGRYVIGSIGPHTSPGRWMYSVVAWGTPIRRNAQRIIEVQYQGKWVLINKLPMWKEQYPNNPAGATLDYLRSYESLLNRIQTQRFGIKDRMQLPAPFNSYELPGYWTLNDFGRLAIKYFEDKNDNRKMDQKEALLSDFMHTTPDEELETILSQKLRPLKPMELGTSHGCIHMLPNVLQSWVAKGYLRVGGTLEIHPYTDERILPRLERTVARPGIEVHFYPGAGFTRDTGLGSGAGYIGLYRVTKKQLTSPLHALHG